MNTQTHTPSNPLPNHQKTLEPVLTQDMLISIRRILFGDQNAAKQLKSEIILQYS